MIKTQQSGAGPLGSLGLLGLLGLWASGPLGLWVSGSLGLWASGPLGLCTYRMKVCLVTPIFQVLYALKALTM